MCLMVTWDILLIDKQKVGIEREKEKRRERVDEHILMKEGWHYSLISLHEQTAEPITGINFVCFQLPRA